MIRFIGEEEVRGSEEMQHMDQDVVIKQESTREEREVGAQAWRTSPREGYQVCIGKSM
jgi:hypothetical protein